MSNDKHIEVRGDTIRFGFELICQTDEITAVWVGDPEENKDGDKEYLVCVKIRDFELLEAGPYSKEDATEIVKEYFDTVTLMT